MVVVVVLVEVVLVDFVHTYSLVDVVHSSSIVVVSIVVETVVVALVVGISVVVKEGTHPMKSSLSYSGS